MKHITDFASARKRAYDSVEESVGDEAGEHAMVAVYSIEKRILRRFRRIATPAVAMELHRQILCQFGKPDWNDRFVETLGKRILLAL